MSYVGVQPEFYQMLEPQTPWHPGAPGWKEAPYPSWGDNPNLMGPRRQAMGGCGCSGVRGIGEEATAASTAQSSKEGLGLAAGALALLVVVVLYVRK